MAREKTLRLEEMKFFKEKPKDGERAQPLFLINHSSHCLFCRNLF